MDVTLNFEQMLVEALERLARIEESMKVRQCPEHARQIGEHEHRLNRLERHVWVLWGVCGCIGSGAMFVALSLAVEAIKRKMGLGVLLVCLALAGTGCTRIEYKQFRYWSLMQEKSLCIQGVDEHGQPVAFTYSTNSDPAVDAFKQGVAAGAAVAGVAK